MSNKSFQLVCFLLLALTACNPDKLEVAPGNPTENIFFTSEADFEGLIRGVYAKLTELYNYNQGNWAHPVRHLPGDDITTVGTNPFETFAPIQPAEGRWTNYYSSSYRLIARANTALQKIATVSNGVYTTPGLKDQHQGEALFLRGLMYFNLANTVGTSPLIVERIQDLAQTSNPGVADGELLNQAIRDFSEAAKLVPETYNARNNGRVNKNAAYGMLGKALVFRATISKSAADYTAAIQAFDQIKNRSLMPDFADNFDAKKENNSESLFEFQASQPPNNDNVFVAFGDDFEPGGIGSVSAFWGFYENNSLMFGAPRYLATQKLAAAFDKDDPRLASTLNPANRFFLKYWQKDQKTQQPSASANNPRILRLADVLLLKAEAIVQTGGNLADAIGLVNQIRTRARNTKVGSLVPADLPTTLNAAETLEAIQKERFLELAGEESHRWFDLRRWHKGGQINLANWDFSTDQPANFAFDVNKHLLFPVPLSETDNNPNVKQNPGY